MYNINCVLLGDNKTGKTTFTRSIYKETDVNYDFSETLGVDFINKTIIINNNEYKIKFWDLSGSHRFIPIFNTYLQNASIVLIFFSYNDINSIYNIRVWVDLLKTFNIIKDNIFLLGSWDDIKLEKTKEELDLIKTIVKDYDYKLYNINCKNYKNIYSTFCKMLINSELSIFYRPLQFENILPCEESNINNNEGWLRYVFPCLYKD